MRDTLLVVVEEEGFDVHAAANGYEAIEHIKNTSFDLVICDIRMAGMDGIETLTALRKSQPELKSIVITGYASSEDPIRAIKLGVDDYLYKPFDAQEFLKSVRKSIESAQKKTVTTAEVQLREDFVMAIKKIAQYTEERNPYYPGHSKRVSALSIQLFRKLGLPKERISVLEMAALLHDIGQLEVPEEVLNKKDKLTPEELEKVKRHPIVAKELFQSIPGFQEVVIIIFHHHEKFDGTGYPQGIKGEDIPIESRIIAITETYDALTSERPHRAALTPEEAMEEITRFSGSQFDPRVVTALTEIVASEGGGELQIAEEEKEREEELSKQKRRKTLINLAHTFRELGQYQVALQAYEESLQMEEETQDILSFESLDGIARLSLDLGEISRARFLANKALSIAERFGKHSKAVSLCTLGLVMGEEGRWSEAEEYLRNAREIFEMWEDHQKIALTDLYLASIHSQNAARSSESKSKFSNSLKSMINLVKHYDDYDFLFLERKRIYPILFTALTLEIEIEPVMELLTRLGQHSIKDLDTLKQSPVESNRLLLIDILERIATDQAQDLLKSMTEDPAPRVREKAAATLEKVSGKPIVPILKGYCFGKFKLCIGDHVIKDDEWKTKKAKYVLAYLLAYWNEDVPEEKVLYAFWPDSPPKKARQSLHTALYQIRQLLSGYVGEMKDSYVLHEKEFYNFNNETEHSIDLKEFEQLYKTGSMLLEEGKEDEGIAQLQKAESLYVGEFLEGYFSDWAIEYRDTMRKMYIDILVKLGQYFYKAKKYEVCLDYSQKILAHDSCRQDIHMTIMKCHQALGQKELAIRQYQICSQILKRELNISPSTEIMALYLDLKG